MNIRKGSYKLIAISRVLRVITNKSTIICLGLFVFLSPSNLIYADIFASFVVCIVLLFGTRNIFFKHKVNSKLIKKLLIKYRQFPIYNLPSDIVFRIKQAVVVFLFLNLYNEEVVGYYSIALLILTIPSTIIGSAFGEVFYKESAEYQSNEELRKSLLEMLTLMLSTSLIIFLSIALVSDRVIPFLLGNNWSAASNVISVLVIMCFSDFIIGPFLNVFKVLNLQKYSLIYQSTVLIFSILSIWIGTKFDSYIYSFLFYSITNFLIAISILILIFRITKIKFQSLYILIKVFINIIPSLILILFYKNYQINTAVYYDFIIIFISICLNYYLNLKYIPGFKIVSDNLIINPLNKLCKRKS